MRDADEDEETRVLSADMTRPAKGPASGAAPRQGGLPLPLIPPADPTPLLTDDGDEEATRLMQLEPTVDKRWLVSDGPKSPVDFSHTKLLEAVKNGRVSPNAFVWQKGMKEWKKVADLALVPEAAPVSVPSSPPPRRSHPRAASQPRTPDASVALSAPKPDRTSKPAPPVQKSRPPTPTQRSASDAPKVLLSTSASTADFSDVTPVQGKGRMAALSKPGSEPPMQSSVELSDASEKTPPPQPRQAPRPAAGRRPAPDEPVAKTTTDTPPDIVAQPPAVIVATGLAQAKVNPKIETQREATEPARSRLPLRQLYAAGRPPNLLLWVLGAGGWVLSGVLAGMLIAKNDEPPVLVSSSLPTEPPRAKVAEPSSPTQGPTPNLAPAEPEAVETEPTAGDAEPTPPPTRKKPAPIAPALALPQATPGATLPTASAHPKQPVPGSLTPSEKSTDPVPPTSDINTPGF